MSNEYRTALQDSRAAINVGAGALVGSNRIEQPRLHQQLTQLEKILSACHESANSLERIADRILGPVPQGVGESMAKTPVESLERRIADAIGYGEALLSRLNSSVDRLKSAV